MHQARRRSRLFSVLLVVPVLLAGAAPAVAHRDGCHRWHSCPSDTGSYVCGDLGDFSECGTTETTEPAEPEVYDYEAPSTPRPSRATAGAKGAVRFTMTTERGARIAVTEDGKTVARATGTGGKQTITFKARTGTHTYLVTSTDKADNTSDESSPLTVTADATAPEVSDIDTAEPTPEVGAARFNFTTEPGAAYSLSVRGQKVIRGTAASAAITHDFWLANGTYPATLKVTDPVGNVTTIGRTLKVGITRPALTLTRTTADNAATTTYDISGTPRSRGSLSIVGLDPISFTIPDAGRTSISAQLKDGTYPAGTATLTDFAGRRTSASVSAMTIDTTKPALSATLDRARLRNGLTRLALRTEPGVPVLLSATLIDSSEDAQPPVTATLTAADGLVQWEPQLPAGSYTLTAVAKDAADNATTFTERFTVEDPLTPAEIAIALGALFVVLLLVAAAALLLWLNRHRIAAWREKRARQAAHRAHLQAIARTRLAHDNAVAAHRTATATYEQAHAAWATQRQHLAGLLNLVEHAQPQHVPNYGLVRLKPGEFVYGTIAATLVDQRTRQGQLVLVAASEGQLAITSNRLVFDGPKNREWSYDKLTAVTITADDIAMMTVTNRKTASGVRASATGHAWDRDNLLLVTALADAAGQRDQLIADQRRRLDEHDRQRPTAPQPPPVPEALRSATSSPSV